jgi:GNAT superfamily N-acetyltransferase
MEAILEEFAPERLAAAIEESQSLFFQDLGRLPQVRVRTSEEYVRVTTGVPFPFYNGIVKTRLALEAVEAAIDREVAHFAQCGLPFVWWTGPSTAPADLGERLRARGFVLAYTGLGMAADLRGLPASSAPPAGVTIERVADAEALAHWVSIALNAFGLPPALEAPLLAMETGLGRSPEDVYQRFLGTFEGHPVACSSVYMGAGVAGLHAIWTIAAARRKGIGTAMTLAPLLHARERGYRVGVLSASSLGEPVYRRLGFGDYCRLSAYVLPGEVFR